MNALRTLMAVLFIAAIAFVPVSSFAGDAPKKAAGKSDIAAGSADKKADEKAADKKKADKKGSH